jgi:hypothetical protein
MTTCVERAERVAAQCSSVVHGETARRLFHLAMQRCMRAGNSTRSSAIAWHCVADG